VMSVVCVVCSQYVGSVGVDGEGSEFGYTFPTHQFLCTVSIHNLDEHHTQWC